MKIKRKQAAKAIEALMKIILDEAIPSKTRVEAANLLLNRLGYKK